MSDSTALDRFYEALGRGDIAAARACFIPGAWIWHCFDDEAQDVDTAAAAWEGLVAHSRSREIRDIRRRATEDGCVQQHVFVLTTPSGERKAWAVCLVIQIDDGRIARLEEYIDRAASYTPA